HAAILASQERSAACMTSDTSAVIAVTVTCWNLTAR
ncbi:MAG: hypothetical protein K0S03_523, partial [Burkholderiales bacterium]|nr:hypothetical protein [Burkholderiales bacterium]